VIIYRREGSFHELLAAPDLIEGYNHFVLLRVSLFLFAKMSSAHPG
jgi:hypothetical protein